MSRGSIQWVLMMTYMIFAVVAVSAGKYGTATDGFASDNSSNDIIGDRSALYEFTLSWTAMAWMSYLKPLKLYAFGHLIQPVAIIMIEGYRGRNKLTPLGLPVLWLMLIQYAGIGVAMPLYYLIYTLISDVESYWWPLRRFVPLRHARHIFTACVIAEAIHIGPVLSDTCLPQWMEAAKSFWPLLVPVLVAIFGSFGSYQTALGPNKALKAELKLLGSIYLAAGLFGALWHFFAITQAVRNVDPNTLLNFGRPAIFEGPPHIQATQQTGLFVYFVASYVWAVQAIWDLNRVGRAKIHVFAVALWILLAFVSFGPGASVAGVWYIREHAMSRTSFQRKYRFKKSQFYDGDAVKTGASTSG